MAEIIVIALTFALCFGADKLFSKLFRSDSHHKSGKAVRLSKRYAAFGAILGAVGMMAVFAGISESWILSVLGVVIVVFGIGLMVYYATFGVFYDKDSFLVAVFGQKNQVYHYADITAQQLYVVQGGSCVVELHLKDGRAVQLQSTMTGFRDFLNFGYERWLQQTGRKDQDCQFHDPDNFVWFPPVEV